MTKILIVSDSHGSKVELEKLLEKHGDEVDIMLHCGDSELSSSDPILEHFRAVRGNCDFDRRFPEERLEEVGDRQILVTHGHRYSVKSSLLNLSYRGKEVNADILCFGHSHVLGAEMIDDMLFINPGSILLPRLRKERTYVILELSGESAFMHVYDIESGEMPDLFSEFRLQK
ncbi:YfcE family phosphodiesterase [Bacillus methanolicus]|uniref:metallophosphoesterase n=1 Tax=Bacillus methanolicus TaxID=1471 RepID=UPI00200E2269|nr:metallophosphoesterase [Bacillus methanolicus]UQD52935.1 YfcE family phosphodiesterase [Bacillus methanolicus]